MYIVDSPLAIYAGSKRLFRLNLNMYRNAHHFTLNKAKINYKELMKEQIERLPVFNQVSVDFHLFPKTKHKQDVNNICCIHDKFFMDALVEFERLIDDNYDYYPQSHYYWGSVDKLNPRVEIHIKEL